jgi:hypothetical protein
MGSNNMLNLIVMKFLSKFKIKFKPDKHFPIIIVLTALIILGSIFSTTQIFSLQSLVSNLKDQVSSLSSEKDKNIQELNKIGKELEELKNQDQVKINQDLNDEIKNIQNTYNKAVATYETLVDFRDANKNSKLTGDFDKMFSESLKLLSERKYNEADDKLSELTRKIDDEKTKITVALSIPANIPASNIPPGSGYSRQNVNVEGLGNYLVSIIAADLSSTRVIVDTASDSDCSDNCPVLPLSSYASRNSAYAGVNGSYFCPASYPSCAGKTNTFDLLAMNYKKTYFNSSNNVYSGNPAVIFGDNYIRFITAASQWGRDTSPNGVLSNYPLLVFNFQVVFGGDDDPKKGSKGGRSFIANKGNTVYIGVVHSATVAESAKVLKTMGMENAMNLDDGGSTALWSGGYKVGPGRDLPNAILFVKK